jgi:cytochrome P450
MSLPPGPRNRSPFGQLFSFAPNPLSYLENLARRYGDVVHFKIRRRDVFLLNHPDYIKDVLLTHHQKFVKNPGFQNISRILGEGLLSSEGEFHLQQRRRIQPAFHRQRLKSYISIMCQQTTELSDRWVADATVDVYQEMARLTLTIVSSCLFNTGVDEKSGEINQALTDAMSLFEAMTSPRALLMSRLPLGEKRFERGLARLDDVIYGIINGRKANMTDRGDLLSILMAGNDSDGARVMTNKQLRDEALTLFLAGHETSAVALTWTWYLLSRHPEARSQLLDEIDSVLGGRSPSEDDVKKLTYTKMVLAESMRLYPPVYMIGRQALEDFPVGPYVIPAGASIIVSQHITQRDERFYSNPDAFEPLRWLPEKQAARPKYAYFPFGAGPRVCIGESFAWLEMTIILAILGQEWRFEISSKDKVRPQPRVTLRPKDGMPATLRRRN